MSKGMIKAKFDRAGGITAMELKVKDVTPNDVLSLIDKLCISLQEESDMNITEVFAAIVVGRLEDEE